MKPFLSPAIFVLAGCFAFSVKAQSISVAVSSSKYSCEPASAKVVASGGTSPYYYNWSHGAQGSVVTNLTPGSYNVSIVDAAGKDTLVTVLIEEEKCKVAFSGSFSPNSDGIADTWAVGRIKYYPDFLLQVYNRWGQLVHSQKGEYIAWDGKHLGVDLPVGTYYYVFYYDAKDSGDIEKGSVTIMR
jgi:gliding motility-associated-like protein